MSPSKLVHGRPSLVHYGVILLLPAGSRAEALERSTKFLSNYDSSLKVDPYVEMTVGELEEEREDVRKRLSSKRKPSKMMAEKFGNGKLESMSLQEFGQRHLDLSQYDSHGNALSTKNPKGVWRQYRFGGAWESMINDVALPLAECREAVERAKEEFFTRVLPLWYDLLVEAERKGDRGYLSFVAAELQRLKQQEFHREIGVFNVESHNMAVPQDPGGWWAVVVDMW